MSGKNERKNMLSLFTYYADKTFGIRETPGDIVFRDITCENADRIIHYNFSGNEAWQLGGPLSSVHFENVTAKGALLPLCVYGDPEQTLRLSFRNCRFSFRDPVPEFLRGAYVEEITADGLSVEGVDGPFFRQWQTMQPHLSLKGLEGLNEDIVPADGPFSVKPI